MTPRMRTALVLFAAIAIAAAAFFVGYIVACQTAGQRQDAAGEEGKAKSQEAVTAKVTTAPARRATIEKTVTAYGTVIAAAEDVQTLTVPFECRVRRVLATVGQPVGAKDGLIEVEPSPDALLQLQDARSTSQAAAKELAQVQQRLDMKLATKSELLAAQQAVDLAQSKLDSLEKRGIERRQLQAGRDGLVSKVSAQEGQIIPAGGPLLEVVPANRIQVRLGVEPTDAAELELGQAARIIPVQGAASSHVQGTVKLITRRVNPASRLVDVYIAPQPPTALPLETYVRGRIIVAVKPALVVPREAVLPIEDKRILYTIHDGKAVSHEVKTGLDDGRSIEILEGDVKAGEPVVIEGNYELQNGMAVEIGESGSKTHTQPAAQTQSASQPEPHS